MPTLREATPGAANVFLPGAASACLEATGKLGFIAELENSERDVEATEKLRACVRKVLEEAESAFVA